MSLPDSSPPLTATIAGRPLPHLSRTSAISLSLTILAIVAVGDYLTAWYYLFDFFYLIPLSLFTVYMGKRAGYLMSLICTSAWTTAIVMQPHTLIEHVPSPSLLVLGWNFAMRVALQSSFAWLLAQLVEDAAHQRKLASELTTALNDVNQLRDLIPICAWCKRVRDDTGYWKQVDEYLQECDLATFTHGICPECERKTFGG